MVKVGDGSEISAVYADGNYPSIGFSNAGPFGILFMAHYIAKKHHTKSPILDLLIPMLTI